MPKGSKVAPSSDRLRKVSGKESASPVVQLAFALLVSIVFCALGQATAYAQAKGTARYFRVVDIGKVGQPRLGPGDIADVRVVKGKVPKARWPQLYYTFAGYEGLPANQFIIIESTGGPPKSKYSGQYSDYSVLNMSCIVEFNPVSHTLFTATGC